MEMDEGFEVTVFGGLFVACAVLFVFERFVSQDNDSAAEDKPRSRYSMVTKTSPVKVEGKSSEEDRSLKGKFYWFQFKYLSCFLMMTFADWMQGPYVYALYAQYGFSESQIAVIFSTGYLSSLTLGSFFGSLSDTWGRKRGCILCGVSYALACFTKRFPNFYVLLGGRLLSGISTSLLFSAFEAWMVSEHRRFDFPKQWLSKTFYLSTFLNSLGAMLAGLTGNVAADFFGPVAPFDLAGLFLLTGAVVVLFCFTENYGTKSGGAWSTWKSAIAVVTQNFDVALLGVVQALFEGSMYCFVFLWTPTLRDAAGSRALGHGLIFACFMACMMIGSTACRLTQGWFSHTLTVVYLIAAVCFATPLYTKQPTAIFVAFLVFEMTCGFYYPSSGPIRSRVIPESVRASVISIFRMLLNLAVMTILYKIESLGRDNVWRLCAGALLIGAAGWAVLTPRVAKTKKA